MYQNVRFGSDAEVFLKIPQLEQPFPVCGLIGGTKDKPIPLGAGGFFVQEDNCAAEFNIPICDSVDAFSAAFRTALRRLGQRLPPTLTLDTDHTSVNFHPALLDNPQAQTFGCEPDYNAWTGEKNPRPECEDKTLRTAAAHVHVSWENPTDEQRFELIRAADVFVTCAMLPTERADGRARRKLYGRSGACRLKEYGVEHRVLGNQWIMDKQSIQQVWDGYQLALAFLNQGHRIKPEDYQEIQDVINEGNTQRAGEIYAGYKAQIAA